MLKTIVLEGARGTGKSTVSRLLRNHIFGSTLINPTGFSDDGEEGLKKIQDYYKSLMVYLKSLHESDHTFTVIFDRIFFSEMVYSQYYKSYNFMDMYDELCKQLLEYSDELYIYFFVIRDRQELQKRLMRDKVELFENIEESVDQSLIQQEGYERLFDHFLDTWWHQNHLKVYRIETSHYTPEELKNEIIKE